ncbi:MAG: hypothetical protein E1N59_596 [Puniceicoccaceae bacterium 5H]|nr:MAG: hypothetical protein E1N59_596 [Puniceicoccaceae bacterium 5H]
MALLRIPTPRLLAQLPLLLASLAPALHAQGDQLLFWQEPRLDDLAHSQEGTWPALRESVLEQADAIVQEEKVYSVTFNDRTPPSGNVHDYYSTGPYWWPNPDTADGLPYVRRDGEFNPERDKVSDREPLHQMIHDVRYCALAYRLTGEERYAKQGVKLLRAWFLDPETYMRPNLNHAQAIPGRTNGRGTGIIDAHPLGELADGILVLADSKSLSDADLTALQEWYQDYFRWLITNDNGRDEASSVNNHGTAFDLQAASVAHFIGNDDYVRWLLEESVTPRIERQIRSSGAQPEELVRTRTWSYCTENLEHFYRLALLGLDVDVDLMDHRASNGASLDRALGFLLPYVCEPQEWPYPQETEWDNTFIRNVLAIASGLSDDHEQEIEEAQRCVEEEVPTSLAPLLRPH